MSSLLSTAICALLQRGIGSGNLKIVKSFNRNNTVNTRSLSIMHTSDVQNLMRLVFRKSILAVNPPDLVQREILLLNNKLHVRERSYDLKNNCYIVGFGKCVVGMACKVEQILGSHLQKGIISIPYGFMESNRLDENSLPEDSRITVFEGAKDNLPDKNAELASKEIKALLENLKESDVLIVLISGGGSALLTLPKPPVTLEEKLEVIKMLGGAGANIIEMNIVRKKLSLVKGGGLATIAYPCKVAALILSDIIGDPLDMIASGPTVINQDEDSAALKIIEKYDLSNKVSSSVFETLRSKSVNTSEKDNVQNVLIGNNRIALEAAARECTLFGFSPVIVSDSIRGLVSVVCDLYAELVLLLAKLLQNRISLADFISELNSLLDQLQVPKHMKEDICLYFLSHGMESDKFCLIFGGETTVKVVGNGSGGRSQELSLRLGLKLHHLEDDNDLQQCDVVFLSGGTDGIDGPTNAAGAIAYSGQIKHALEDNLNPNDFINRNDSNNFFQKFNKGKDLVVTGHTGVNVMDIHILIVQKKVGSK